MSFFQTATENIRCCLTAKTMACSHARQITKTAWNGKVLVPIMAPKWLTYAY